MSVGQEGDIIAAVEASLLEGQSRADIVEAARDDGVDIGAVDRAIAIIADRWIQDAAQTRDQSFAYHVRTLKHLYEKSYRLCDYKTCLQIMKQLAKVQAIEKKVTPPAKQPKEVPNDVAAALKVLKGGKQT